MNGYTLYIIYQFLSIGLAFYVGYKARQRNQSVILWFALTFFFPYIMILPAYFILFKQAKKTLPTPEMPLPTSKKNKQEQKNIKQKEEQRAQRRAVEKDFQQKGSEDLIYQIPKVNKEQEHTFYDKLMDLEDENKQQAAVSQQYAIIIEQLRKNRIASIVDALQKRASHHENTPDNSSQIPNLEAEENMLQAKETPTKLPTEQASLHFQATGCIVEDISTPHLKKAKYNRKCSYCDWLDDKQFTFFVLGEARTKEGNFKCPTCKTFQTYRIEHF